jgi:Zn-dependent protease/predicted transcriptional regulator
MNPAMNSTHSDPHQARGLTHARPLRGSLRIGRLFGIDVHVHVTFLALLALIATAHALAGRSLAAGLGSVGFLSALFACVLLHEFGHALAARHYGIRTSHITLLPIGGIAHLESLPRRPVQELWVALAGPLVNVLIAGGLALGLLASGHTSPLFSLSTISGSVAERLIAANLLLVAFNLLPAFPMDGGRVLRALLALRLPFARATRIAGRLGQGMAVAFGLTALFFNPLLLLVALLVWTGAAQEMRVADMKQCLDGAAVRDAMLTRFESLQPSDRLDRAVELVLRGWQQDFPVMENDCLVGVLTRDGLLEGLRTRGASSPVAESMRQDIPALDEADLLENAVFERKAPELGLVPVTRGSRVVGMLTAENVGEFVAIRSALQSRQMTA